MQKISQVIISIIAIIAVIVTVLDFFNLFGTSFPFDKAGLMLLSLLSIYLVTNHFHNQKSLNQLDFKVETIKRLPDSQITIYENSVKIEAALGGAILNARKSICDFSWKNRISTDFDTKTRKKSHSNLESSIKNAASHIRYREVFIFNDKRRVEKLKRRIRENIDGYSCRYFKKDSDIPRLQYVIVDDEEVFYFASSSSSPLCSIKDPRVANIFLAYFEEVWNTAIPIKEGKVIHTEVVDYIIDKFG